MNGETHAHNAYSTCRTRRPCSCCRPYPLQAPACSVLRVLQRAFPRFAYSTPPNLLVTPPAASCKPSASLPAMVIQQIQCNLQAWKCVRKLFSTEHLAIGL